MFQQRVRQLRIVIGIGLIAAMALSAPARSACTIHVSKTVPKSQWPYLALLSFTEAERAAREHLKVPDATSVVAGALEVRDQCLFWSFLMRIPGDTNLSIVHVDAGDGNVLLFKHPVSQTRRQFNKDDWWWYE